MKVMAGSHWVISPDHAVLKTLSIAVFGLFACVFFDPSDQISGLKSIFFVLCLLLSLPFTLLKPIKNDCLVAAVCLGLLLPSYQFFIGVSRGEHFDLGWAVATWKSYLFILALFFLRLIDNVVSLFRLFCFSLAMLIIAIYTLLVLKVTWVYGIVDWLSFDVEAAMIGYRHYGTYVFPMIYWKSSILLIIGLGLSSQLVGLRRSLYLAVLLFALFLSGTRANILVGGVFLAFLLFTSIVTDLRLRAALGILLALAAAFPLWVILSNFLSPTEVSNTVKLGHLNTYIDIWSADPLGLIVGQGMGSGFLSPLGAVKYESELTLLETLRRGGVFALLPLFIVLLMPLLKSSDRVFSVAYSGFLLVILTNPLLISSTGMVAIAVSYLYVNHLLPRCEND